MVMIMESVGCGGGMCGGVTTAADGLSVGNNLNKWYIQHETHDGKTEVVPSEYSYGICACKW